MSLFGPGGGCPYKAAAALHTCACACVRVCVPRDPFESAPTARFNNPKVLPLCVWGGGMGMSTGGYGESGLGQYAFALSRGGGGEGGQDIGMASIPAGQTVLIGDTHGFYRTKLAQ